MNASEFVRNRVRGKDKHQEELCPLAVFKLVQVLHLLQYKARLSQEERKQSDLW